MVVGQVQIEGLGVAAPAGRELDEGAVELAGAGRGAISGRGSRARVGGHLIGRFCRRTATRGFQVGGGRFPADSGFFSDSSQWPLQAARC